MTTTATVKKMTTKMTALVTGTTFLMNVIKETYFNLSRHTLNRTETFVNFTPSDTTPNPSKTSSHYGQGST
eukprot:5148840-Ditylum_brightwellii.AAC.1